MLKCIFVASVTAIAVEPGVYSPSLGNWRFYGGFGSLQSKLHLSKEAVSYVMLLGSQIWSVFFP